MNSFQGIDSINSGGQEPPDTQGAAGPSEYIETVNQAIAIYNKSTGQLLQSPSGDNLRKDFSDFFNTAQTPPVANSTQYSDPVVTYDNLAKVFIIGDQNISNPDAAGGTGAGVFDIAVSTSSNPTSLTSKDWNFFQINTTEADPKYDSTKPISSSNLPNYFGDYPGNLGYNADALVFTLNELSYDGSPSHALVVSVSMSDLTAVTPPANLTFFKKDAPDNVMSLRPTAMHDSKAGDPMWLVTEGSNNASINVVKMTNVLSGGATFTTTNLAVNPYYQAVPELQPNKTAITTPTKSRIMNADEANGLIVAAHQVSDAAGDLDEVQWYEIATNPNLPNSAVISSADPELWPLDIHGGPTPTMALKTGSSAYQTGTPLAGITTDQRGYRRPDKPSLGAFDPGAIAPAGVTITASNATPQFSQNAQNVALSANVSSGTNAVNEGTVTFRILQGTTVIGTATSGRVRNGQASAYYVLPAGLPLGSYTIEADYRDDISGAYASSYDDSHTLTLSPASTTIAASNATAVYSTNARTVALHADVTSSAGTINAGTVTFLIQQANTDIVKTDPVPVYSGSTSNVYVSLPLGLAVGSYAITAVYNPSGPDYDSSTDENHTLTVTPADTAITTNSATADYSESAQNVTLTANVSSITGPINEGQVTFQLMLNGAIFGTPTSSLVHNGQASVSYALPAGLAAGSYAIYAAYTPGPDFTASTVWYTKDLTINPASTTTVLIGYNVSPNLINNTAQLSMTARVNSPAGAVNEGTVIFTIAGHGVYVPVQNDMANAQLILPLAEILGNHQLSIDYFNNGSPALLDPSSSSSTVGLSTLLPISVTSTPDGGKKITVPYGISAFVFTLDAHNAVKEISYGPYLHWFFDYAGVEIGSYQVVLVTIDGIPWQAQLYDAQGNLLGSSFIPSSLSSQPGKHGGSAGYA